MKIKETNPPLLKGISIRQSYCPPETLENGSRRYNFSGGIDTRVYLDGRLLDTVQKVEFSLGVNDVVTEVKLTMLAETLDADLVNTESIVVGKAMEEREYVLGSNMPIYNSDEVLSADFADESGQFVIRKLGRPTSADELHKLGAFEVKRFMRIHNLEPDAEGINRDYMRMDNKYVVVMCRSTTGVVVGVAYEKET